MPTSVVVSGSYSDSLSDSHGTMLNSYRNVLHSDSYLLANTDNSERRLVTSRPANSATLLRLPSGILPSLSSLNRRGSRQDVSRIIARLTVKLSSKLLVIW